MEAARDSFETFAKHGKSAATGKDMDNKNFSKICKDAKIVNKLCTTTDVDIVFTKVKAKGARTINFDQFCEALKELAKKRFKGQENGFDQAIELIGNAKVGAKGVTKTSKTGGVSKLTDTSLYTGAHKERFNADGSGKGIEGRVDKVENTGYVGNYKGEGTYDDK